MSKGFFEVFEDGSQKFRWRMKNVSGANIAVSAESYANKEAALVGVAFVKENAEGAPVQDLTGT
jgi:uncharacterized protein YegP (UPF0339 family)